MILVSLYHVVYLAFYREGRRMLLDMLPELKDATDMVDVFAYYLGFSRRKPQFKRFNYAEKMEYWALVWGTFVMALTGFMIWFKMISPSAVPRWVDRCRHHGSLLRGDSGHAGDHRLAFLPGYSRS